MTAKQYPDEGVEVMVKRMTAADRDWAPTLMSRADVESDIDRWFQERKKK